MEIVVNSTADGKFMALCALGATDDADDGTIHDVLPTVDQAEEKIKTSAATSQYALSKHLHLSSIDISIV